MTGFGSYYPDDPDQAFRLRLGEESGWADVMDDPDTDNERIRLRE